MGRLTVLPITVAALSIVLLPACRNESAPTGPDRNVSVPESSPSSPGVGATPESPAAPELDCLALDERRVRFTDPGFSSGNRVGLYFLYSGVPNGEASLEIIWDEEGAPEVVERFELDAYLIQQNAASRDYRGIVEHSYSGLTEPIEMRVRVTLRLEGYSNDCATVRRVTVAPQGAADGNASPGPTRTMTCRTTLGPLGSNVSPGFPVFIPPGRTLISRVEFTITPAPPPGSRIRLATFDFFGSRGTGVINNVGQVSSFDFALRSAFRPVCSVVGTFDGLSCTLYWNCNP